MASLDDNLKSTIGALLWLLQCAIGIDGNYLLGS